MVLSGQSLDRSLAKILKLDDMKIPESHVLQGTKSWLSWKLATMTPTLEKTVTIALVGKVGTTQRQSHAKEAQL